MYSNSLRSDRRIQIQACLETFRIVGDSIAHEVRAGDIENNEGRYGIHRDLTRWA